MKIVRLFCAAVIFTAIAACSAEEGANGSSNDIAQDKIAAESNVPILFAPVSMGDIIAETDFTRGGSVDGQEFTVDSVGVFCLATNKISASAKGINMTDYASTSLANQLQKWMENDMGSITSIGDGKGSIGIEREQMLRCYPETEWYAYGFAAYHPWTKYLRYVSTKTVYVYIPVDGNDDVFYGVAGKPAYSTGDAEVDKLAFSKQYYDVLRDQYPDADGIYPQFEFKRLMSRLDFYFKFISASDKNFHVEKVEFDNFPYIVKLGFTVSGEKIANSIPSKPFIRNKDGLTTDKLDSLYGITNNLGHFELREQGEIPIAGVKKADGTYKYNVTTDFQKVGDCIMIPPVDTTHTKRNINLFVTLADDDGKQYRNTSPFVLNCPAAGWKQGRRYDVQVTLNEPPVVSAARSYSSPSHPSPAGDAAEPADLTGSAIVTLQP